jgi:hypothetical protein
MLLKLLQQLSLRSVERALLLRSDVCLAGGLKYQPDEPILGSKCVEAR